MTLLLGILAPFLFVAAILVVSGYMSAKDHDPLDFLDRVFDYLWSLGERLARR